MNKTFFLIVGGFFILFPTTIITAKRIHTPSIFFNWDESLTFEDSVGIGREVKNGGDVVRGAE